MITEMKGCLEKLAGRREVAIIGLLTQPTLEAAAKSAHVSATTLWRWQQDPGFQAECQRARRQSMGRAMAQLQQASLTAVKTLKEIMDDSQASASARVMAARTVLEMGLRAAEIDNFGSRLSALECAAERIALRFQSMENGNDEPTQAA